MKLDELNQKSSVSSVLYHDNSALDQIKQNPHSQHALEKVAGQFEAMFLQMVLRQMRSSSDVLADEDSPFSSQQQGVFRDMYDGQLAIEMANKQGSGIADMLVKQLSPSMSEVEFKLSAVQAPANDKALGLEETSQHRHQSDPQPSQSFQSIGESVASIRQVLSEASVTTAFAQPLNRKGEL
ncbi:rod-binding protein [Vibrio aquimaris]|uniref:Peptidoglycan hydrolase FlgJ n=1 Tax=Vibrio aquimaris TaxID=2587862 RepID=A0A5P9CHF7_9VIBR|nr:rod-binding protein [Vibrio aquimaris]QFT25646.1 Peptidoglycan hydrolase FlgJ [Vibrio aquimaris]